MTLLYDHAGLLAFVQDAAEPGCGVIHGSRPRGTTCLDIMDSARAALHDGTLSAAGPR